MELILVVDLSLCIEKVLVLINASLIIVIIVVVIIFLVLLVVLG